MGKEKRGTLYVVLAALLYSIGGLCIKVIPWGGMAINGARNMVAIVVLGLYLAIIRHKPRWNRWIALGALAVCGTNIFFALATKMTTAANAIVLQFTAPIFVLLVSVLFLHKRPGRLDLLVCGAVFLGVLCFFVESLSAGDLVGNLIALCSGLSYAGVFLLNDLPGADPISSVFWGEVCSIAAGLPFLLRETQLSAGPCISLIVLGVFQVGLAYVFMCRGLETTPAVTAALISGIEPVLNPILVAVFYHETIGPLSFVGAAIVILSIIFYQIIKERTKDDDL